jgi:hypothetical protein
MNTLKDNVLKEKFEEKTRRFTLASNKKNKTESLKTLPEKTGK